MTRTVSSGGAITFISVSSAGYERGSGNCDRSDDPTSSRSWGSRHGTPAVTRIDDYALLGDLHTAALVSREGSVDWMCVPRFDSAARFGGVQQCRETGSGVEPRHCWTPPKR